jgi:cell division protein FtsB
MENNELNQEIAEAEKELATLKAEQKILETFFKKGMDNNKYKELLLQKKENETWIAEIELELELLKNERDNG